MFGLKVLGALFAEAEFAQNVGHVVAERFRGRIFLADDFVELRFGVFLARAEAVVPNVERLERAAEPLLDELPDLGKLRRRQHFFEHRLHARLAHLPIFLEPPGDERGHGGRKRVGLLFVLEHVPQLGVARVWFRRVAHLQIRRRRLAEVVD